MGTFSTRRVYENAISLTGAAFSGPLSLSPLGWWDAGVGVTQSGGAITGNVLDQSGNGNTMAVNLGATIYSATGFNGLPCFQFAETGSGGLATISNFPLTGNAATLWFAVVQKSSPGSGYGRLAVFCPDAPATNGNDYETAGDVLIHRDNTNQAFSAYEVSGDAVTTALADDTAKRLIVTFDGSNCIVYINNSATPGVGGAAAFVSSAKFRLGAGVVGGAPGGQGKYDVAEAGVIARAINATERGNLDAWLANKYGI